MDVFCVSIIRGWLIVSYVALLPTLKRKVVLIQQLERPRKSFGSARYYATVQERSGLAKPFPNSFNNRRLPIIGPTWLH